MSDQLLWTSLHDDLEFYDGHRARLHTRAKRMTTPRRSLQCDVLLSDTSHLSAEQLTALLSLFPPHCDTRTCLQSLAAGPTHWIDRRATNEDRRITTNPDYAVDPNATVVGETSYSEQGDGYAARVTMYALPETLTDDELLLQIAQMQGTLHEATHALLAKLYDERQHSRTLTHGGTTVQERVFVEQFGGIAATEPPISRYADAHRPALQTHDDLTRLRAACEQVCEAVAAYFMGIAVHDSQELGTDPLPKQSPLRSLTEFFLKARRIESSS